MALENVFKANMCDKGVRLTAYISQKDLKRYVRECLAIEIYAKLVIPLLAENRADDVVDFYRQGPN